MNQKPSHAAPFVIRRLDAAEARARAGELADILLDCVEGGASVSFMADMTRDEALAFWEKVADGVAAGGRILLAAESEGRLVGTVQVVATGIPNQPHRSDLSKMLVRQQARGQGVGQALLHAAESASLAAGMWLMVLDTVDDSAGMRLYERGGWSRVGSVPDFALWPHGGLCPTVYYYKDVRPAAGSANAASVSVRPATEADLPDILAIVNHAIVNTTAIWDETPTTIEARAAWLRAKREAGWPVLVAEEQTGGVAGFASFGDWRAWPGYRHTVENSLYVRSDMRRRGVGTALMTPLLAEATKRGMRVMVAGIESRNEASRRLHARHGFREVGAMREVGYKFGRWLDLTFMQKKL
jgi:L-amino acid N-acyltransferase YncA